MASSHLLGIEAIRRSIVRWSVLYHSRGQNGKLFVGISSSNALNSLLQIVPQIFYRIQVRNCEGHGRTFTFFALNHFCTMADLCLWPLSCWNIHPVGIFFLGKRKHMLLQYLLVLGRGISNENFCMFFVRSSFFHVLSGNKVHWGDR